MMSLSSHTTRFVSEIVFLALLIASSGTATGQNGESFDPMEATIEEVQQAMEFGLVTRCSRPEHPAIHFL